MNHNEADYLFRKDTIFMKHEEFMYLFCCIFISCIGTLSTLAKSKGKKMN